MATNDGNYNKFQGSGAASAPNAQINPNPYGNPYVNPDPTFNQNKNNFDVEGGLHMYDVAHNLRLGFIRKVYGILSIQLTLTVLMALLTFTDSLRAFCLTNIWLFYLCLILSICIIIPLICCKSNARSYPTNYILCGIWTFCEAYMVSVCCAMYDPLTVISAASLTAAVTVALTIYAYKTETDFTYMGGLLYVGICLLFGFGFLLLFVPGLKVLYCIIGVFLYSLYLIYDTQLVMGKFGTEFEVDDYIIAAIMIYIDIIQIFLYLLQLLGDRNN